MSKKQYYIYTFLFGFIIVGILSFSTVYCINKFVPFNILMGFSIALVVSILLSVFNTIILAVQERSFSELKVGFWHGKNIPKLYLFYIILVIFINSITSKNIWDASEIKDVLSTEWTIFSLSITIFLVWDIVYVNYIKRKQPVEKEGLDYLSKYYLLIRKMSFNKTVESGFSTIVVLTINLFLLIISSLFVHIIHIPENLLTQNLIVCTFYFSTNCILMLFYDIVRPLKEEKEYLRKVSEVSKEEFESAKENAILQNILDNIPDTIKDIDEIPMDVKKELTLRLLLALNDAYTKDNGKEKDRTSNCIEDNNENNEE